MSLRMINDVLTPRDVNTHCPLCGRSFARFPSDEEHIFPQWLQHHHDLWTKKLNIPNFLGKPYKSVKIRVCKRCNGITFGALEARLAPLLTSANAFAAVVPIPDFDLAVWLGKIMWLLVRKSHSFPDYRTRDLPEPDRVLPNDMLAGTLFLGMFQRAFATRKGMRSCFLLDPPMPALYGEPFSLYRFPIDRADRRFESFDFMDNSGCLGLGFRTGNLGLVCLFDGGLHRRFRSKAFDFLRGSELHPLQFSEVVARMLYDQTVLDTRAARVTYFWNPPLKSVIAQTHTPRFFDPYMQVNHDPRRLAELIGRYTFYDPDKLVTADGRTITFLADSDGHFMKNVTTEEELASAAADPTKVVLGPLNVDWRLREEGPKTSS